MVVGEFRVNEVTAGKQRGADVTAVAGGFAVVWQSENELAIKAKIYNSDGTVRASEFQLSTETYDLFPSKTDLATLTNGNVVAVWEASGGSQGDDAGSAIKARIFDASGLPVGGEFLVNEFTAGDQVLPSVSALADGGFTVSWQSGDQQQGDTDSTSVKARTFDADGSPRSNGLSTSEDAALVIDGAELLANDTDVDGDTLTIGAVSATSALGASITLNPDGSVTYDPTAAPGAQALAAGETATDTFTYTVDDGHGGTDTATVSITVIGADEVPDGVGNALGYVDVGYEIHGYWNQPGDRADVGRDLTGVGDINGDGLEDVLFSSFGEAEDIAHILYSGAPRSTVRGYHIESYSILQGFGIADSSIFLPGDPKPDVSSVAGIGDVNGDGIDDFAIAADYDPGGSSWDDGKVHIVYGRDEAIWDLDPLIEFDLDDLDGTNGLTIEGLWTTEQFEIDVAGIGDFNGDGVDDVAFSAPFAEDSGLSGSGTTYVVYGQSGGIDPATDIDTLDGTNGIALHGEIANQLSGNAISGAGDINGDGLQDIVIGAVYTTVDGEFRAGKSYVVFGTDAGAASIDLGSLDGTNGFTLSGDGYQTRVGWDVTDIGDLNGDGFDDLAVSAPVTDPNASEQPGNVYIIYGTDQGFAATVDIGALDGTNGFVFRGYDPDGHDGAGWQIDAVGDVNGDGIADLLVGSRSAAYLVYGSTDLDQPVFSAADIDGSNGYTFVGTSVNESSVAGLGDVNGDGIDDIGLGGPFSYFTTPSLSQDNFVSVIHGGDSFALLDLGDFSRDGIIDTNFMMSLLNDYSAGVDYYGDPGTGIINVTGHSAVVDGGDGNDTINVGIDYLGIAFGGAGDDTIVTGHANMRIDGEAGNDTIEAGAFADIIRGGLDDDTMTGGTGSDTFLFGNGFGNDVVTDFEVGIDTLDFSEWSSQLDFSSDIAIAQVGDDTLVTALPTGDSVLLEDLDADLLSVFDFVV